MPVLFIISKGIPVHVNSFIFIVMIVFVVISLKNNAEKVKVEEIFTTTSSVDHVTSRERVLLRCGTWMIASSPLGQWSVLVRRVRIAILEVKEFSLCDRILKFLLY